MYFFLQLVKISKIKVVLNINEVIMMITDISEKQSRGMLS